MARTKSFETAAARRRKDPIVWTIDDQEIRLLASVELLDLAELIEALQATPGEGESSVRAAANKRQVLIEVVERFIEPQSQERFKQVLGDLDIHILSEMVQELLEEYSGAKNPTKRLSSTPGSETTGETLTDGAQPEVLTQSA